MNNKETQSPARLPSILGAIYALAAALLFTAYIFVYQYAPLPGDGNDSFLNLATPLAATVVAAIATAIYLHYQPEDPPRKVWFNLMVGGWLWASAEALWVALDASLSAADVVWVGGFVFFTLAFYHQYTILFPAQKDLVLITAACAWTFALLFPLLGFLGEGFTLESYVNYYYPIADFFVAAAGLALIFVFRGGALLRPWIGLAVFGVSDLFYAWANQAGYYETAALLTLAIDASYIAAYLVLGYGFLGHWTLISYGLQNKR